MRRLTKEQKKSLDGVIKYASYGQLFTWLLWDLFDRKKSDKLIECIELGMSWQSAYKMALKSC